MTLTQTALANGLHILLKSKQIVRLQAENARLQSKNAELRHRLAINSQNSHKPPRSDGHRKKRVQPALPKGAKRAPGGQLHCL
jgi:regulator of replication initiation timing